MFRHLFRNRVFLAGLLCLLLIVIGGTLYLRQVQRQTDEALETTTPTTETQPIQESDTPAIETQPPQEQANDTADTLTDDPVAAAWQRLDYISKNIYEWGGIPSPKAPPLMQEIEDILPADDEGSGEVLIDLLDELARLRDPRSVEIIVRCMFGGGGVWGRPLEDALVAIGPPAVPHLIPYLDLEGRPVAVLKVAEFLAPIGKEYRDELGGAVEHIILPKFRRLEAYFADKNSKYASPALRKDVQNAIEMIQQ